MKKEDEFYVTDDPLDGEVEVAPMDTLEGEPRDVFSYQY